MCLCCFVGRCFVHTESACAKLWLNKVAGRDVRPASSAMPPKFNARTTPQTGAPLQASARPTVPLARDLILRHGRWVKKTRRKHKATHARPPARISFREDQQVPRQMTLKETIDRNTGNGTTLAPAPAGPGSENVACALESGCEVQLHEDEASFVENLKAEIDKGILDLKGNPWVHPCDPRVEAIRINSSRRQNANHTLNSAEVRDLVFRPSVFVWAPHLLPSRPFDLYDVDVLVCVCVLMFMCCRSLAIRAHPLYLFVRAHSCVVSHCLP